MELTEQDEFPLFFMDDGLKILWRFDAPDTPAMLRDVSGVDERPWIMSFHKVTLDYLRMHGGPCLLRPTPLAEARALCGEA